MRKSDGVCRIDDGLLREFCTIYSFKRLLGNGPRLDEDMDGRNLVGGSTTASKGRLWSQDGLVE